MASRSENLEKRTFINSSEGNKNSMIPQIITWNIMFLSCYSLFINTFNSTVYLKRPQLYRVEEHFKTLNPLSETIFWKRQISGIKTSNLTMPKSQECHLYLFHHIIIQSLFIIFIFLTKNQITDFSTLILIASRDEI